ncbi:PDZ domain-containing protein, partial [Phascolarctobacterium faecium]
YKGGVAEQAGIEIGDIIVAINNRPVKEILFS